MTFAEKGLISMHTPTRYTALSTPYRTTRGDRRTVETCFLLPAVHKPMPDLGDFTDFSSDADDASNADPPTESDADFDSLDVAPAGDDRGLGTISVSQGLKVAEDGDDTRLRAFVTIETTSRRIVTQT
jgi:hypothetical protein